MSIGNSLKKITKGRVFAHFASSVIRHYIRFVQKTTTWRFIGQEHVDALEANEHGFILAFWHDRLLMAPVVRQRSDRRAFMLISNHRDGEIIARAVAPFGIEFIRGSAGNPRKSAKDKGGAGALAQMIAALQAGGIVGVTPDGPRGPARSSHSGVLKLAQLSGAPILPAAYATNRGVRLKTWDRFYLALPFSRGAFVAGPPLSVDRKLSGAGIAEYRRRLDGALDRAVALAEDEAGCSPNPPGSS